MTPLGDSTDRPRPLLVVKPSALPHPDFTRAMERLGYTVVLGGPSDLAIRVPHQFTPSDVEFLGGLSGRVHAGAFPAMEVEFLADRIEAML